MAKRWGGFVDDDDDYDYETREREEGEEEEDPWKNWDGVVCHHHSGMDGNHGKEKEMGKDNGNEEGEGFNAKNTMNIDLETKKQKKNDTPGRRWGRVWGLKRKGGDGNGNHGV